MFCTVTTSDRLPILITALSFALEHGRTPLTLSVLFHHFHLHPDVGLSEISCPPSFLQIYVCFIFIFTDETTTVSDNTNVTLCRPEKERKG